MNDLDVIPTSEALKGRRIDVVVTGSIAAVESVRFIRALRRLGADVTAWLSEGGSMFVTPMALTWASSHETRVGFSGHNTHICDSDAVVIAPASSSIITKIARGMTDSHCTALAASALGQKKPVMLIPTMHDSLKEAPAQKQHLATISSWPNTHVLGAREEEGKQKFPDPATLADEVSHVVNKSSRPVNPVLITMGTTRGYIDDVRYISNYSSGKLGSLISEELYRNGFQTFVVCGPCEVKPRVATTRADVLTTGDMLAKAREAESQGLTGGVFCASVLDFEPSEKTLGKIRSTHQNLTVHFKPTPKIIGEIQLGGKPKIGFKLETGMSPAEAKSIADTYIKKYGLTMLIANELHAVSASAHHAFAFPAGGNSTELKSKDAIARLITDSFKTSNF
jgi:phosphopantothenoylcysteine decarboxylase/phosphopantothenate--cysteine ligase